ncbi:MAG: NAD-dependent epimerase/dehydratase family protein [Candidatus Rokubacteria bacterium]|nr:NAD-dependent epimerase/dehydratase family protein [Candidatus Rokubacteria bacterium]
MKTFRVGLVGAGYVSEFHIKALKRLPHVRIVGVTDLDPARAQATGLPSFRSLAVMAAEGLDVVHVLTPPDSHAIVALEALALGCHVLVEKPLATSVDDCDRLAGEATSRGVNLCVSHSLLGDPFVAKALHLVRSGAIGEIIAVEYLRSSNYPPHRGGPLPPPCRDGGFPFRDLGVHALYLLQEFLGDIQDLRIDFRTSGARSRDPNLHFDEWRALVRCARGAGGIHLSWSIKPLQHQLIIQGTRGTLRADLFSMFLTRRFHTPLPKAVERVVNAIGEAGSIAAQVSSNAVRFMAGSIQPYQGLHNFVRNFYDALATGGPMPAGVEQARAIVRWTEQAAREADHAKAKFVSQYRPSDRPAVVVTGANGHLGRAFVNRLIDEGEFMRLFVRRLPPPEILHHPQVEVTLGDLGDPEAVDRALANATTVFHIGAAMGGGWEAHEAATITGTRNIVEACHKHRVGKLIHISSLSVTDWAGHPAERPVTENSPLEPFPQQRGYYTRAKLEAERIVRAAAQERSVPALILRLGQMWSESSPLITAAVGMRAGRRLILIGDRSIRLPLIHVDDAVEAMVKAARSPFTDGRIYQCVGDGSLTREELASLYAQGREPHLRIIHVPMGLACFLARGIEWLLNLLGRPASISPYRLRSAYARLVFDCRKAREELGWRPRVKTGAALRKQLLAWRVPAQYLGGQPEMGRDLANTPGILDRREEAHASATARPGDHVGVEGEPH